jgi:hypothetical protein
MEAWVIAVIVVVALVLVVIAVVVVLRRRRTGTVMTVRGSRTEGSTGTGTTGEERAS